MLNSFPIIGFALTRDSSRARDFYEKTLGLDFVGDDQSALVLRGHGNMIRIAKAENFVPVQSTVLGWEVRNIEEVVSGLKQKGVAFENYPWVQDKRGLGIWTTPNGDQVAWFKDPDGNVLSLSEHK